MTARSVFPWRVFLFCVAVVAAPNVALSASRGDGDGDGDIDLIDFAWFQHCFTGSTGQPIAPGCAVMDFNDDSRIDTVDLAVFVGAQSGPGVIPPTRIDNGLIIGRVFHADTELPLADATITAVVYSAAADPPDLPPLSISSATGDFQYQTIPFDGSMTFLLRIRKPGFAENLRRVEVMAGRCWRVADAYLTPITPPVMVTVKDGGMLTDLSGDIELEIPPGALVQDSMVSVTQLPREQSLRTEPPQLVAGGIAGRYIDLAGVSGDATKIPATLRVPNTYNLPVGTKVRFGKVNHNTLEWFDLRDAFGGTGQPDPNFGIGIVKSKGDGSTCIEVEFDHFCSVCT
ncbi:MAG: hypothetical protein HOP29_04870, partial [Phycisphaerales bacterium]|nr:hypothetical protein [Phycisphaerales bacterium]